ncbi:unnamed protein product [Urochloa humidicola]
MEDLPVLLLAEIIKRIPSTSDLNSLALVSKRLYAVEAEHRDAIFISYGQWRRQDSRPGGADSPSPSFSPPSLLPSSLLLPSPPHSFNGVLGGRGGLEPPLPPRWLRHWLRPFPSNIGHGITLLPVPEFEQSEYQLLWLDA